MLIPAPATAQQRTFVNLGFEQPALVGTNCYKIISASDVPGWTTDHPNNVVSGSCTYPLGNGTAITQPIEIWRGPAFSGLPPRAGNQHAELNAYTASRLSQEICLVSGESIDWRLSHRGRNSAVTPDVMLFTIDSPVNTIATISSTTVGTGGAPSCPATSGGVGANSCAVAAATPNGWRDYSGSFTWSGPSGNHNFGFGAVGGGGSGNFLDEIQITLHPFVELFPSTFSVREGQAGPVVPQIRVSGTVPAGGIVVTANISAGASAVLGADYTTASGTLSVDVAVPAGTYDNTLFSLPITLIDDTVIEDNEGLTVTLQPNPTAYNLTSTLTCGGAATTSASMTLLDNDVDVLTTKTTGNATPAGSTTFTVTYQNNTARPTIGTGSDLDAHDAPVTLADALPAGFSAFTWTCAASGVPLPGCPAASGTGAINTTATLPAGNAGTAGGVLTFAISATLAATQCTALANVSTITANSPVAEGLSVQSGFLTPIPGGAANNTASVSVDPLCSDLSITKTNTPADGPVDQVADTVQAGTAVSYTLRLVNAGPDEVSNPVVRDTPGAGLTCPGPLGSGVVTCNATSTPVGATTCPPATSLTTANLFGPGIAIPSLGVSPIIATPANAISLVFTCTVD